MIILDWTVVCAWSRQTRMKELCKMERTSHSEWAVCIICPRWRISGLRRGGGEEKLNN